MLYALNHKTLGWYLIPTGYMYNITVPNMHIMHLVLVMWLLTTRYSPYATMLSFNSPTSFISSTVPVPLPSAMMYGFLRLSSL